MLIIPLSNNGPQRRFPCVTFFLILLNLGIFLYFQHNEQQKYMQAVSWARSSGLLQIELEVYQEYLQRRHQAIPDFLRNTKKTAAVFQHLIQDDRFQAALRQQILIPPGDPRFADWSPKRKKFEDKLNQSLAYRYGYSPARKNYFNITTYMFFHDKVILLIANILFLWFIGSWIEIGVGRILFLGIYLTTGVCAGLAFGFIHPLNQGPLLGASGAIAGLMGTYLLVYCSKRSTVLCSLGFCSRHTTVFGWFLFPFWISKEAYHFVNASEPQIFSSHLGGLLAGMIIGLILRTHEQQQPTQGEQPEPVTDPFASDPGQDLQPPAHLTKKEVALLRKEMHKAVEEDPADLTALARLFHIDKADPQSEQFHRTAGQLLQRLATLKRYQELLAYFQEYKQVSTAPRLHPSVMLALAEFHIRSGATTQAARFLLLLLKQRPQYPGLPSCLFTLGCVYCDQGREERGEKCFQLICKKYPQTIISQQAEEMLTTPYRIAIR
ncbi:rhomboid family intramembrane serine protease [Candidatus Electrothrix sp.]|uniref:rhomboid family intramembrane serine protease n=1 Tax=Candidatus Electrothrix sp. TaxID=2170559 RepID=UPI0040577B80